ncbi:MAG: S9 family peptidase, partial [Prevotellaceae bacterium]|nr:S9 family peptidase [Prevotellaceae bacterium]
MSWRRTSLREPSLSGVFYKQTLFIQDYYSAIDAVKAEKYVDADNIGALGASYGGYFPENRSQRYALDGVQRVNGNL